MKKIFFMVMCIVIFKMSNAQEPADALRYSWYTTAGTARQQAIGGAMTSLGGDLSATFVNPAGLGFYKTGDLAISPGFRFLNNKATYFGTKEKDKKNAFPLGTTGVVIGFSESNKGSRTRSSAISFAIQRTASFNSRVLYRGLNHQSSYSQVFLEELANNHIVDSSAAFNFPFGSSLAINTFWIDTAAGWSTVERNNRSFVSLAQPLLASGLIQENKVSTRGGITELALGGAGNSNDKFYYGFTLGVPILNFERESVFTEADATEANNRFDFARFEQNLTTTGAGVNLKLGFIFKPVEYVRLGIALHSPSFFRLTDTYNASLTTNTEGFQGTLTQSSSDPDLTGLQNGISKYWYFTPYRIMVSGSYVLREIEDVRKQKGFLTADIEFVNYRASSFTTDPDGDNSEFTKSYYKTLNKTIDKIYKPAFNFKVGGELKFTTIMVRLGAAYYGNPYKNIEGEKGNKVLLSGGLGYRNKGMFIDLAYVHSMGKDVNYAYRLQGTANSAATIKSTGGNAVLTFGFKI